LVTSSKTEACQFSSVQLRPSVRDSTTPTCLDYLAPPIDTPRPPST